VVLETGGAVEMPWINEVAGILEAWYPGTGGADAIADILFGKVNPSGRLPVTFPRSASQYPRPEIPGWGLPEGQYFSAPHDEGASVGYRWLAHKAEAPLFPFGFGLTYTRFEYKNLAIHTSKRPSGSTAPGAMSLSFTVTNAGTRAGSDVSQAYLLSANGESTLRLIGFKRVALAPGQSTRVELTVDPRLLAHFDERTRSWRLAPGQYEVAIAPNAVERILTGTVRLPASTLPP